eukprot:scaffold248420_cov82-Cyclotella_meneghiniana.AAC.5
MANFCKAIRNSTRHLFLLMDPFSIDDDCISYYFGSGEEEGFIVIVQFNINYMAFSDDWRVI